VRRLDDAATALGLRIGLEMTEGFDWLLQQAWHSVGVTLDVGHMYLDGGAPLRRAGTLGGLIRRLGPRLAHLHLHDYNGQHDHVPLGTGRIDLSDVLCALRDSDYAGNVTLELNPQRATPEEMIGSLHWLRQRMGEIGGCTERVVGGHSTDDKNSKTEESKRWAE
jgi:sugar phosphate isomerase/epimerase